MNLTKLRISPPNPPFSSFFILISTFHYSRLNSNGPTLLILWRAILPLLLVSSSSRRSQTTTSWRVHDLSELIKTHFLFNCFPQQASRPGPVPVNVGGCFQAHRHRCPDHRRRHRHNRRQASPVVFGAARQCHGYRSAQRYCYCTKSNHFRDVMEEAVRSGAGLCRARVLQRGGPDRTGSAALGAHGASVWRRARC